LNIIGYAGLLVLVIFIYFAITQKRLFDIRLIVARSFAYILLGSVLVSIYAALIFGLANRFLSRESILVSEVLPIVVALFIAATAPFFKRFFDKVTNRVFYRDAYDPQAFLDQLNQTLVGNIELGILLRHTSRVIEENLKSNFCFVCVCETPKTKLRIIGVDNPALKKSEMEFIKSELLDLDQKTVLTDDIAGSHHKLKELLVSNEISVIVRLASGYDVNRDSPIAYLVLGQKKSGNIYNKQDLRIIEIIADELVIAIQNALRFEEIADFNVTLQSRINQATEKLRASNQKLKEMDETKDEFIGMASHQLRTPLTSVKGYLSMVLDGDAGLLNEQQTKLLDQAFASSQRMVYLIADLLNVSRLKTGKFVIEESKINLHELVQSEIAQLKGAAKAKKLKLIYYKPHDFPQLLLDSTKIRQVIMNFIDNAIYYTPKGSITIELTHDRRYAYFTVRDEGLGVPEKEQEHLFTKFFRASNAKSARPDGTGLGLFMAKKVVTAQGGHILFESREGQGSTFGFKFPLKHQKLRTGQPVSKQS
jgi:signal transduction histidine kinase